jgi:ubiquinone/menaquinone biosynthesis C-methylase UbiE
MTTKRDLTREDAIEANIYVHGFLANSGEYQRSPHFRPENREKVRHILERLTASIPTGGNAKLIDFGCGTGFIIDLATDLFAEVHGIDITQDMMKHVDLSSGNVHLHESLAEKTPFEDNCFEFATAYSFMDHLFDYHDFLKEAYRVLKPGGLLYSDLNPNRAFIDAMVRAETVIPADVSPLVQKEIAGALHNGAHYEQHFGLDGAMLEKAEPIKSIDRGFDANEVFAAAREIGFSDCKVEYEWFLGQAHIMHQQSPENAELINQYLTSTLPVSSHLYKYLRFILIK